MARHPFFRFMQRGQPRSLSYTTLPDHNATVPLSPGSTAGPSAQPAADLEAGIPTAPMQNRFPPPKRFKRARVLSFACLAILLILLVLVVACSSGPITGPVTPTPTPIVLLTSTPTPGPQIVIDLFTAHGYDPQHGPQDRATQFAAGSPIYAVFQENLDSLSLTARGCLKGVLQANNVFAVAAPTAILPDPQAVTGGWAYLLFQPSPPASSVLATITIFWSPSISCNDLQAIWHVQAQVSVTIE